MLRITLVLIFQSIYAQEYTIKTGPLHETGASILTQANLTEIGKHGCWCSRLNGIPGNGHDTVDQLDSLCKLWFMKRRCLGLKNGSCDKTENGYTGVIDYNLACSGTDPETKCGEHTCKVDLYYISEIKQEIKKLKNEFHPVVPNKQLCKSEFRQNKYHCRTVAPRVERKDFVEYIERTEREIWFSDKMDEFRSGFKKIRQIFFYKSDTLLRT